MQEEIESRTVNLAISTTKLTARTVVSAVMMYLRHRKLVKDLKANEVPSGKQSVKDLLGQNQGVSNIDIAKTDLKGFEGVARKYGIDFAPADPEAFSAGRQNALLKNVSGLIRQPAAFYGFTVFPERFPPPLFPLLPEAL